MDRVITMLIGVTASIGLSAIIFIGANRLFDVAPRRWAWFTTALGALGPLSVFAVLWGNRVLFDSPLLFTILATVVGGLTGLVLGTVDDRRWRLAAGAAGGVLIGLLAGLGMRRVILVVQDGNNQREIGTPVPFLDYGQLVLWVVIGLAVGAAMWVIRGRRRPIVRTLVFWGTLGWAIGAFGVPELGTASRDDAILSASVLGLGLGAVLGLVPLADGKTLESVEKGSRKFIFLTPALFFVGASLVLPTIRTVWLSFLDKRGVESVGADNYAKIFGDANIIDVSGWTGIFTSRLFIIGAIIVGVGFVAARVSGRRHGAALQFGPASMSPVALGLFLVAFAVFAVLRGTIINNLWWVFTVTIAATAMGLAIAVLADRSKRENLAKSIIFMPMAISFVGAGIIWRFMYIARPPVRDQTGVVNSLWVWLGELSNSAAASGVIVLILTLIILGFAYLAWTGYRAKSDGLMWGSIVLTLPLIWLIYRFLGPGIGGFSVIEATGALQAQPIQFTSERPFNNLWLMVVLIWIQTGFAMVIFSAAIKAVPSELLEAAEVDGATESQSFWRVTVPQIGPTIGVVVTTLIVTVMKVFDIVRVMTAGNFDTNVIANEMYDKAFAEFDFGVGSALAVILFVAILPIMFFNIRRMQKAAV
jgi:alpha-glucoside transport system permease protein